MRFTLTLLLLGSTLLAAPVPKDLRKPDDAKAIVGTWVGIPPDQVRFRFQPDGTLHTWYGANESSRMNWTWAISDPKATPKRARINRAESPTAGYDCVYELSRDSLTFALILTPGTPVSAPLDPKSGLEFHRMTRLQPGK